MGGAVSIIRASSDKRVNCLVSIAGVAYPGNERLSKKQSENLNEKGYVVWWNKYKVKKNFYDDADKYDLTKYISKIKVPVLIIHGDKDDVVNQKEAKDLYKSANEPKQFEIIKGAKHEFGYLGLYKNQNETKEYKIMKNKILEFLGENLK